MKKLMALGLALTMFIAVMAGCGQKDEGPLTMGTNAGFPPFEYKEGTEIVGIDVEIAKEIAKEMGKELEISDMEFASVVPSVQSGKVDLGIAGMTIKPERLEQVDFSDTYYKASQLVIVKKDSAVTAADLNGKKIGVQDGTTGDDYASETYGSSNVSKYPTGMDAVMALTSDKIDAVIIDSYTAKALAKKNADIKVLDEELTSEEYAIAVQKGNTELLETVNKVLKRLKEDGSIDKFTDQFVKE